MKEIKEHVPSNCKVQLCCECENHYIDNPQSEVNWLDRCKKGHVIDDGEPESICRDYNEFPKTTAFRETMKSSAESWFNFSKLTAIKQKKL